jgi:hypothetical protein
MSYINHEILDSIEEEEYHLIIKIVFFLNIIGKYWLNKRKTCQLYLYLIC